MPEEIDTTEDEQESYGEIGTPITPGGSVSFPWGMAALALFIFDPAERILPLLVPGIGLIMGYWQKIYAPKTDPVLSFFLSKIAAIVTLGLLPDNLSIVIFAFIKKRAASKEKSPAMRLPKPAEQTA